MKNLKTALSLLMVFCMLLSFGTFAFAEDNSQDCVTIIGVIDCNTGNDVTVADSGTVNNNGGTIINNGGTVNYNSGTVNNNEGEIGNNIAGTVVTNHGTITDNYLNVTENAAADEGTGLTEGTVTNNYNNINTNNGTVTNNAGYISENYGTVTDNAAPTENNTTGGLVEENHGTVTTNNGTINFNIGGTTDSAGGVVETNNGTIYNNQGTVKNNEMGGTVDGEGASGIVENNWGGTVGAPETVQNQYYNVDITTENAAAGNQTGFTDHNGASYLLEGAEGTVTVTPESGYSIAKPTLDADSGTLTVEGDETNGWQLTFSNLLKNIKLLITGKKDEPKPDPDPQPQPDPKPEPKPVAAATNDWSDGYYLFNKAVVKQINNAEDGTTVTVDATGWASFMRMVFEALAEHPTVTLVVKYGNNKELTVPAGADILSAIGNAQDVLFTKLAKLV